VSSHTVPFRLAVDRDLRGRPLVAVAGEVDCLTASPLRSCLHTLSGRSAGDVVVDLSAVTFFDAAAVRTLLTVEAGLNESDRHLVLRSPSPIVSRVLGLAGISDEFATEPNSPPG
jgi:anti-anti-sigma factor